MIKGIRCFSLVIALATLMPSGVALAQSGSDHWQYRATIYGWVPNLNMKTEFPSGASGPSITIDASTLVDNLDFALMGAFEAKKGEWGVFSDLMYTDLGHHQSVTRDVLIGSEQLPAEVTADVGLKMDSWIWTAAGTYELVKSDKYITDLVFGVRMLDISQSLSLTLNGDVEGIGLPAQTVNASVGGTNWDGIIGLKGYAQLGSSGRWHLPWYFDMGTGDSQFTWQGMIGLGYRFSWGDVIATYRYMDYDFDSGDTLQELSFYGPMVGASFAW